MNATYSPNLPEPVKCFLNDLVGALGDQFIGAILFGSRAKNTAENTSDIDVAVIISDLWVEQNRQLVLRTLGTSSIDRNIFSLSIESYLRLKEFIKIGDPFAWVVCTEGIILKDRAGLLAALQKDCRNLKKQTSVRELVVYLHSKSQNHYEQARQTFQQFLSNMQLCLMAGAQAVAADRLVSTLAGTDLVAMASWENLKTILVRAGVSQNDIELIERLILAQKHLRIGQEDYIGKEIMDLSQNLTNTIYKMLPQESNEKR